MSYTSDRRMKNVLKSIHMAVLSKLEHEDIKEEIKLRIFDESREDSKLWHSGGLTFTDPKTDYVFGSNDCAWYFSKDGKDIPLVVVEGTFGTERGQFGDGQNNRFSHILGVAKNGYTGVLFTPFRGESYVGLEKGYEICKIQACNVRKPLIKSAITICDKEPGKYFVIDAYSTDLLIDLIVSEFKNVIGIVNDRENIHHTILGRMKEEIGNFKIREDQVIGDAYDKNNNKIDMHIRFFTQNYDALTTSQKRDGHGLFGKILLESYLADREQLCVFVRLTRTEIENIMKKRSKEVLYIFNNFKWACLDDLLFLNGTEELRINLYKIKGENLHDKSKKQIFAQLKESVEKGKILIKI